MCNYNYVGKEHIKDILEDLYDITDNWESLGSHKISPSVWYDLSPMGLQVKRLNDTVNELKAQLALQSAQHNRIKVRLKQFNGISL